MLNGAKEDTTHGKENYPSLRVLRQGVCVAGVLEEILFGAVPTVGVGAETRGSQMNLYDEPRLKLTLTTWLLGLAFLSVGWALVAMAQMVWEPVVRGWLR